MRHSGDLAFVIRPLLIAFAMLPLAGCLPYTYTTQSTTWMAGPDDVDFRFVSHTESRSSIPISYGVGTSIVKSEMFIRQDKGRWRMLFTSEGEVSLPQMGADATGRLWIRWNERWEATDIHLSQTQRPGTLNEIAPATKHVKALSPLRSSVKYLNRGDDDVLPSVTPFGVMNDHDGERLEWLPDAAGRFTRWIEPDKAPLTAIYRPGFEFDRIDRRRDDQLLPDAFLYVQGDKVVGVYWRRITRPLNDASHSLETINHIVGWIQNNQVVRIELEPPATNHRIRPARRTFSALSVPLELLLRSEFAGSDQLNAEQGWLSVDSSRLAELLSELLK